MMTKLKALFDKKGPLGSYGSFVLRSLTGLFLAALFLTWFLEYRYFINNTFRAWDFLYGSPVVFLYNALILFFCMALIWIITHRLGVTIGATWITLIIITYIHINKFNSRETPLLPEDFALADQASTLTDFIDTGGLMRLIGAILLVIILTILFETFLAKKLNLVYKSSAKKILKRNMIAPRVFLGIITIFAIMSSTAFARHNNGERYEATFLGTRFTAWNQNTNYSDNGFILGFLYNLQKLKVSEPEGYSESTLSNDMTALLGRFASRLPQGGRVLDLGCGSGRDTIALRGMGFSVVPVDGSEGMCRVASENTGSEVRCLDILDLDYVGEFDGVWACASLLHLKGDEIPQALTLINRALVDGGVLYMSFKLGRFYGIRDGRWYTDMDDVEVPVLSESAGFEASDVWNTADPRGTAWVNAILTKRR